MGPCCWLGKNLHSRGRGTKWIATLLLRREHGRKVPQQGGEGLKRGAVTSAKLAGGDSQKREWCTVLPIHLSQRTGTGRQVSLWFQPINWNKMFLRSSQCEKKNTQTKNNSIYLFICIHYCGQELATSPRKHILFATHPWGDSSHGRSLWAAVVKGMLSCIISSRQGSWIGSLSWNSCLGWNDSQRQPRL